MKAVYLPSLKKAKMVMSLETIYLKSDSTFSTQLSEWASAIGVNTEEYDFKSDEISVDGLLVINANQDIDRETEEVHAFFDVKHFPTQKVDINGTLQVAVSNFQNWMRNFKCKTILILGADDLIENENLDRFLKRASSIKL